MARPARAGSHLLRATTPLQGFHVYVVGFHPAKDDPGMQMEAHHFCRLVDDDLLQCVLFDGNTREANLISVEYIVSERLFATLPETERDYWHPHNFEILSGQLVAPGLPEVAEHAFLRRLMNSYGKTWHTWHTGRHDGDPGTSLPLGDPVLMWSFNREGECDEAIKEHRNAHMGIDLDEKRARREELLPWPTRSTGWTCWPTPSPAAHRCPGSSTPARPARVPTTPGDPASASAGDGPQALPLYGGGTRDRHRSRSAVTADCSAVISRDRVRGSRHRSGEEHRDRRASRQ